MEKVLERKPIKIVKPGSSSIKEYIQEVWLYRHLIVVFAKQEFKVQYAQTKLSVLWVVLRPLLVIAIFTLIFDRLIHIPGQLYPYPLFAITGLIIWNNFSFMVNNGGNVIINNQQLIKKMYFPRVILIFAKLLNSLVEVCVTFILLLLLLLAWQHPVSYRILVSPFFILLGLLPGLCVSLWLNALTIKHRDLHQFVPTLVGFLVWLMPVFYPGTIVPSEYSFILYLNPIAGAMQGLRWAILGDTLPSSWYIPSFIVTVGLLLWGSLVFIRAEDDLADII
jgi:lipopolysaccharide transport system permease protein